MAHSQLRTTHDNVVEKLCPCCKQWKPATLEYFNRRSASAIGLAPYCKVCKRDDERRRNNRQPQKYGEVKDGLRCCTVCNQWKPNTPEFFYHKSGSKGLVASCKECVKSASEQYRQTNPEKVAATRQRYYKNNYPKIRAALKRYEQNNPHKVSEYHKRSRLRNPETWMLCAERRRARKCELPAAFYRADWRQCLDYWNHCCVYCGNQRGFLPGTNLTADHFIPLNSPDCPGTVPQNIVPACGSCNSSKFDHLPEDWLTAKFGKAKARRIVAAISVYFEGLKGVQK